MTQLRRRQKEEIVRQTLARIPISTASASGAASQLDANGTILDVDVINNGEVLKRVGTSIVSAPVGAPGAHATTHQPGGTDPMAVDAAAATGSLRTIGTGGAQAAAGNDARLTDARTPLAHKVSHQNGGTDQISVAGLTGLLATAQTPVAHAASHQPGGGDAMAVDAAAATGSLRTLGTGAAQAAAGNHTHATGDVTSGRFVAARLLAGLDGLVLMGKGAAADPAYTSRVAVRLTADNAAIAAAVPTTALQVANLTVAALINDEYDIEWILDIANSIAADVFVFNVTSTLGTLTGRFTVEGTNGVPNLGAGVVKLWSMAAGTLTTANANAPGATGTIGLVLTVVIRARVKLTVANGTIQLLLRAGTNAAASSGTATVKAQSQMIARKVA